ncbi:MAG TPA: sigma-70 family RNA polymerase sigma factor [Luteolibacter sp.]|nr:sigma-70 family RNA polymerase sigma factor [Luteolibacter sp.]
MSAGFPWIMRRKANQAAELAAYVKLMTEHQASLRAFIVSLMPGSPDVADVLQETNAALWQKRDRFEPGTNFLAWAFRIARYEVLRQHDRQRRSGRVMFSSEVIDVLAEVAPAEESDEELFSALDQCLDKLSESQQELVRERYTPGHSLEDLAARTGRTAGSLRIALLRIREVLRRCIEDTLAARPS